MTALDLNKIIAIAKEENELVAALIKPVGYESTLQDLMPHLPQHLIILNISCVRTSSAATLELTVCELLRLFQVLFTIALPREMQKL